MPPQPSYLTLRILVVDDTPHTRYLIAQALRLSGHSVVEGDGSAEGLRLFVPGEFDAVVTDYNMPGMNGLELATQIRLRQPEQPIVLLSAHAGTLPFGEGSPIDIVLQKPLALSELTSTIRRLCAAPRAELLATA